jgi:WD40 repeat protein
MDGSVRLRDPASGRELVTLPPPGGDPPSGMKVFAMAFSPDGRRVAWVDDSSTIRVWDVGSRRPVVSLAHARGTAGLTSVAFSPDGRRIATGTYQGGVKVWDADTGENVYAFPRQEGVIRTLLFSPDGRRLVADAGGGAVNVWDAGPGATWERAAAEPAGP